MKFFVDERLRDRDLMICGANREDYHFVGYSFKDKDYNYCDLVSVKKVKSVSSAVESSISPRGSKWDISFSLAPHIQKHSTLHFSIERAERNLL